jgi:hypothetical protein
MFQNNQQHTQKIFCLSCGHLAAKDAAQTTGGRQLYNVAGKPMPILRKQDG